MCVCVEVGGRESFVYMVYPSSFIVSFYFQLASLEVEKHELTEAKKTLERDHRSRSSETQALADKITRLETALSQASAQANTLASGQCLGILLFIFDKQRNLALKDGSHGGGKECFFLFCFGFFLLAVLQLFQCMF